MLHKVKQIFFALLLTFTFTLASNNIIEAADFTPEEQAEVAKFQNEYAALNKKTFNSGNIYSVKPNLIKPFNAGKLDQEYIDIQLSYINYYRNLFGLNAITANDSDNKDAQTTAAVMAAIDANPFVNQHGLPSDKRPSYISRKNWKLAQEISNASNLNFNASDQTAGEVITDLLTDRYNLSGSDTGHRAWILSTRLTATSVGAAYGTNGYRYSVNKVLYDSDADQPASREMVAYPNAGVFPIELLQGDSVAWSLYLSDQTYTKIPKITVTDDDTGKRVDATNVSNYSTYGYGYFSTVITYYPSNLKLVDGHQYTVKIGNLKNYSFKLFTQSNTQKKYSTVSNSSSNTQKVSQDVLEKKGLANYLYKVGTKISKTKSKKITSAKTVKNKKKNKKSKKSKKSKNKKKNSIKKQRNRKN